MKTYFYQAGSLPGVGAFPAGVIVETNETGTLLNVMPSLASPVVDPQPTPLPSSSLQAKEPALSLKENGG